MTQNADTEFPSRINHVIEGNRGFLWISTRTGLGRYDGNELKKYMHDKSDSLSLPDNDVYCVMQDADHELWVYTLAGVARYNYRTDTFHPFLDNDGQPFLATAGCIWREGLLFGSGKKVFYYNKRVNSLSLVAELPASCWVEKMVLINDSTLLYQCRSNMVWRIPLDPEATTLATADGDTFSACQQSTDVLVDSEQRIWISSNDNGIYCYAADGTLIKHYTKENSQLISNHIQSLAESEGLIVAGSRDAGLLAYDPHTEELWQFKHEPGGGQYTIPGNHVNELYCDSYGNLLMCIVNHGLVTFNEVAIRTYIEEDSGYRRGPTNNAVMSLFAEGDDVWVGTAEDGLNHFDPQANLFTAIPSTAGQQVFSLTGFTPGKLLLSIFDVGLRIYDIKSGKLTPFTVVDEKTDQALLRYGNGVYLWRNSPETILIVGDSLYVYHLPENRFTHATMEPSVVITKGTLKMVGTEGDTSYLVDRSHLFAFDHQTEKLTVIYEDQEVNEVINTATRTTDGIFWLGTNHGLKKYDSQTKMATYVPNAQFNDVMLLQADPMDRVWVGTYYELFLYDPATNHFVAFNSQDGAQPNEYIRASTCLHGSHLYMGGVHGLVQIAYADAIRPNDPPFFSVAECTLNGVSNGNPFYEATKLYEIPYNSNFFLRVLTLEANNFRSKEYRYWIPGYTKVPIERAGSLLRLYRLPPGNYVVNVSCTLPDGTWSEYQPFAEFKVLPPWYQSSWFILLCTLLSLMTIAGILSYMVARKQQNLEKELAREKLQADKDRLDFLVNVGRELRTPLTLVDAPLKRALQQTQPTDGRYRLLQTAFRQSSRMRDLVNMVLDMEKMEQKNMRLHLFPHPFNQWIRDCMKEFVIEGQERAIQVVLHADSRIDKVEFDLQKFSRVLHGMLINALNHSPKDSTITVRTQLDAIGNQVRVLVSDEGPGLKVADEEDLFTRFYRGRKEKIGNGLGMTYARALVTQHRGMIGAYDNEDKGATFYFILPVKQSGLPVEEDEESDLLSELEQTTPEEEIVGESLPSVTPADPVSRLPYTLLVVDDQESIAHFVQETLCESFKEVLVAKDGVEAWSIVRSDHPDAVISDVTMPRMDGYTLCRHIKGNPKTYDIPVILTTSKADEQHALIAYQAGAEAYMPKPFDMDALRQLVSNLLQTRQRLREKYAGQGSRS